MAFYQESEPAIAEEYGLDATRVQVFAPENESDRTLHLLRKEDVAEKWKEDIALQNSVDPRQQILSLYDEFRPRLLRYIHSMYLKRDQAEEVIQETFLRLTTELLRGKDIENVQGWIIRVAHNLAVDVINKKERDATRVTDMTAVELKINADPMVDPEEAYQRKEQTRRMETALLKLNPQQRQCFHLRVQGFRYKDIGLALGVSEQRAAFILKQVAVRLAAVCGPEERG
jgi:RNA polymerase sigma-70 factor, ECF subfamily